ncbi:MAG TPA: DUF255 domain-containing protein [Gemmata sp.]|jgi:thioredoxin-related protein|nr:DUF255 domain-containing protein [Gemmata sp.]
MRRATLLRWVISVTAIVLSQTTPANAQDVAWRRDYAAARKEATETGRPLLLDFGTEGCVWCRKQDATTFRDPRVVKLLNERFIPVKIDAERENRVTQVLGIESFPTLVLASPEGKVLGRQVGYADVAQLSALLGKAPTRQETSATNSPRGSAAAGVFAQARAEYDGGRYAECLRQCGQIIASHPTTPEAQEARRLAQQIATDPVATQRMKDQIDANLTTLQPKLAASLDR